MSSLVNFFNNMSLKGINNAKVSTPKATQSPLPPSHPKNILSARLPERKRKSEMCIICFQNCTPSSFVKAETCSHAVCDSCLRAYFQNVLTDRRYTAFERIECPDPNCNATYLSDKVTRNIFTACQRNEWWTAVTIKSNVQNKVVCPYVDCGAIFDADFSLTKKCTFVECYECHHGFCSACQQVWHPGVIKIVDDEEEMKKTLSQAEANSWTRCPTCHHLIEKKDGCLTMRCLCGTEFCYRCGGHSSHHTCANKCQSLSNGQVNDIRSQMFASETDNLSKKLRKSN